MQGSKELKEELEQARIELDAAHRAGDLAKMSELQYGKIPELEKQLQQASDVHKKEHTLLRNKVTDVEVAEIVSHWTGIPVSKNVSRRTREVIADGSSIAQTSCRPE